MNLRLLAATLGITFAVCGNASAQQSENFVFSISWEPAFCDSHSSKPECQAENSASFEASNFALHGLWSQSGEYCGVSSTNRYYDSRSQWYKLPAVVLSSDLRSSLSVQMPGVASDLDRHEWIKHGTCSGLNQQDFFATALAYLGNVNGGNLRSFVAGNVGNTVQLSDLFNAVSNDFGPAGGQGVEFLCDSSSGQQMLSEVRLHLALPRPLPAVLDPSYLVAPSQSSSNQCTDGDVYVEIVN